MGLKYFFKYFYVNNDSKVIPNNESNNIIYSNNDNNINPQLNESMDSYLSGITDNSAGSIDNEHQAGNVPNVHRVTIGRIYKRCADELMLFKFAQLNARQHFATSSQTSSKRYKSRVPLTSKVCSATVRLSVENDSMDNEETYSKNGSKSNSKNKEPKSFSRNSSYNSPPRKSNLLFRRESACTSETSDSSANLRMRITDKSPVVVTSEMFIVDESRELDLAEIAHFKNKIAQSPELLLGWKILLLVNGNQYIGCAVVTDVQKQPRLFGISVRPIFQIRISERFDTWMALPIHDSSISIKQKPLSKQNDYDSLDFIPLHRALPAEIFI